MKKNLFFLLLSAILFSSCSTHTINSSEDGSKSMGKISINIDKTNAPGNVAVVIANLIKANSDTLTAYMDLSSDTSANLSFQNVVVGTWKLIILAKDINGTTLYSGDTNVDVSQGTTANVVLTLNPVGNVGITVTWGVPQPSFVDYSYNPVYSGSDNLSGQNFISEAKILFDNGVYKMWYNCVYNSSVANVWYAESNDGINWANKYSTPLLLPDTGNYWDNRYVMAGAVIKDDNNYKMYYNGGQTPYGDYYFGMATSTNGTVWQKNPSTVFSHNNSSQYYIGLASALKVNSTYYMYYSASPVNNYSAPTICVATSSDGINWTKYQGNPVVSPSFAWEGAAIAYPSVIYDGDQFVMIYQNLAQDSFGIAYSNDGLHWTKKYNNAVFTARNSIMGNSNIAYPFFIKVNGKYRIYYTAGNGHTTNGIFMAQTNSIQ